MNFTIYNGLAQRQLIPDPGDRQFKRPKQIKETKISDYKRYITAALLGMSVLTSRRLTPPLREEFSQIYHLLFELINKSIPSEI